MRADVCVVGAGVSGLAVAAELTDAGFSVTVLEAAPRIGGRAADTPVGGYTLADGCHLLHTSWYALRRAVPWAELGLRGFAPGIRVHIAGRRLRFGAAPTRPQQTISALRTPLGTPGDKARLSKLLYRLAANAPEKALTGREQSCSDTFGARGYSAELIDQFLRPYLAGLAGDEDLASSSRGADWLLRMLVRGRYAVPGGGIGQIVRLLSRRLPPDAVRLNTRVHAVRADRVETSDGEIRASAVVVATDPRGAVELFPGLHEPRMRAVTTLWHTAPDADVPPDQDRSPSVFVDADPGSPVARTAIVSRAAPSLAPAGRALVGTAVFGEDGKRLDALDRAVRARLSVIYGANAVRWETLAVRHVEHATVSMQSPYNFARPVRLINGLYVCGDHRDLPNIEGAVQSARRTADAVLTDLRIRH